MGDVGGGALLEGLAGVARLAAALASGVFAPKGFGLALEAVAGGRFAAVGTVHVEALFELRDTDLEGCDSSGNELADGIQPARIECCLDVWKQGSGAVGQHLVAIDTQAFA